MTTKGHQFVKQTFGVAAAVVAFASLSLTGTSHALVIGTQDPTTWVPYDNYDSNGNLHTIPGFPGTWARSTPLLIPGGVTQLQFSASGTEVTNPLDPIPRAISADGLNDTTGVASAGASFGALAAAYPGFPAAGSNYGLFTIAPGNQALPLANAARKPFAQAVSYLGGGRDGAIYGVLFDTKFDTDFPALLGLPLAGLPTTVPLATTPNFTGLNFNQPFFIGDGLTGDNFNGSVAGLAQTFNIPSGATGTVYLLLGLAADPNPIDNSDSTLTITVRTPGTVVPEPGTWLFGIAILGVLGKTGLGMWRCRSLVARS